MKKAFCILLALLLLPLGAMGQEKTTIVASFYPVYVMAKNVLDGVEGVELLSMTAPSTGCLHDYQLLTSDMRSLSRASALLINGAGMEGFLPDVTAQFPALQVVDCSKGIALLQGAEEEHEHHDHDHGEINAHIWLSPKNAVKMVENMAEELAELLPEAEEKIRSNASAYIVRLQQVDMELREAISSLPHKQIVTFHESFPYFALEYGLEIVAVIALEPDEPLSPRMLGEVVEKVRLAGNPPLFSEPQYESAALRAISLETGAKSYELDPFVTGNGEMTAYEDTMRKNLLVLLEALQ